MLPDSHGAAQAAKDSIDGGIAELEAAFKQDDAAAESAAQHAFDEVSNRMSLVMAEIQAAEQQYRATLQGLWGTYKEHHSRLATIKQARAAHVHACGLREHVVQPGMSDSPQPHLACMCLLATCHQLSNNPVDTLLYLLTKVA